MVDSPFWARERSYARRGFEKKLLVARSYTTLGYIGQVRNVRLPLISATSIAALLSAGIGQAHAGTLASPPTTLNIYDLVDDGVTSSDGGDTTVTMRDPLVIATLALEASANGLQELNFTGRLDPALARGSAYPLVPLGAASGTKAISESIALDRKSVV